MLGLGKIWQLPTLPRLKPKYHWRRKVSRPSSEWDRVGPFRNSHQIISNPIEVFKLKIVSITAYVKFQIRIVLNNLKDY